MCGLLVRRNIRNHIRVFDRSHVTNGIVQQKEGADRFKKTKHLWLKIFGSMRQVKGGAHPRAGVKSQIITEPTFLSE